jgi:uncharacterized RDD family membrane protein YckC
MNDDPIELPLFDPPARETPDTDGPRVDPGRRDPVPEPHPQADEPIVVETLTTDPRPQRPATPVAQPATLGPRLAAGIIDLMVHGALLGILIGGSSRLGVAIGTRHAAPLALVLLIFSFLYHVVPLAFWGNTPGMAVAGLRTRTLEDEPLSLAQALRRWLALLLTVATLGLGTLVAVSGRSLADRLSDSQTSMH